MKFCTAVCCMDGRIQLPIINYLKNRFNADYVDMLTEAGINKVLSDHDDQTLLNSILNKLNISINAHGSNHIAVAAHYDCTGNPTTEVEHKQQIVDSIVFLRNLFIDSEFIGLWVDENWQVHEIDEEE